MGRSMFIFLIVTGMLVVIFSMKTGMCEMCDADCAICENLTYCAVCDEERFYARGLDSENCAIVQSGATSLKTTDAILV